MSAPGGDGYNQAYWEQQKERSQQKEWDEANGRWKNRSAYAILSQGAKV